MIFTDMQNNDRRSLTGSHFVLKISCVMFTLCLQQFIHLKMVMKFSLLSISLISSYIIKNKTLILSLLCLRAKINLVGKIEINTSIVSET